MQNYLSLRNCVTKSQVVVFLSALMVLFILLFISAANASEFVYLTESNDNAIWLCKLAPNASGNFDSTPLAKIHQGETPQQGQGEQTLDGYGLLSFKHKGESKLVVTEKGKFSVYAPSNFDTPLVSRDLSGEGVETISKAAENEYKAHPVFVDGSSSGWGIFVFNPETCAIVHSNVGTGEIAVDDIDKIVVSGDKIFITANDASTGRDLIASIETSGEIVDSLDVDAEAMKYIDGKVYFSGEYNNKTGLFTLDSDMNVSEVFTLDNGGIDMFVSDSEGGFYYTLVSEDKMLPYRWNGSTNTSVGGIEGNVWFFEDGKLFLNQETNALMILDSTGKFLQSFEINAEHMAKIVTLDPDDDQISRNTAKITSITPSATATGLTTIDKITEYMESADTLEKVRSSLGGTATDFQNVITLSVDASGTVVFPYTIAVPATIEKSGDVRVYFADPAAVSAAGVGEVETTADSIIEANVYGTDFKTLSDISKGVTVGASLEEGKIYSVYIAKAASAPTAKVKIVDVSKLADSVKSNIVKNVSGLSNISSVKTLENDDVTNTATTPANADTLNAKLDSGFKIVDPIATLSVDEAGVYIVSVDVSGTISYDRFNIYLINQSSSLLTSSVGDAGVAAVDDVIKANILDASGNTLTSGNVPSQILAAANFTDSGKYGMYTATNTTTSGGSSSSSSGCNVGFASVFTLLSLAFLRKR